MVDAGTRCGGRCCVGIQQISPKQAVDSAGTASIKTFDPRAAWPEGGIKRPNSSHFHRDNSFLSNGCVRYAESRNLVQYRSA